MEEEGGGGGGGGGDSDGGGSMSWEDFFGSSTDLVPALLSMYDSLLANRKATTSTSCSEDRDCRGRSTSPPPAEVDNQNETLSSGPSVVGPIKKSKGPFLNPNSVSQHPPHPTHHHGKVSSSSTLDKNLNERRAWSTQVSNNNNNNNNNCVIIKKNAKDEDDPSRTKMRNSSSDKDKRGNERPLSLSSLVSSSSSCSSEESSSLDTPPPPPPTSEIPTKDDEENGCFSNNSSARKECGGGDLRPSSSSSSSGGGGGGGGDFIKCCDSSSDLSYTYTYMDHVVLEIVGTERVYVNDLQEIISGYLNHWTNHPEETLALDAIVELFSNIEEIHKFNSEFLTRLESCGLNPVRVARCFVTMNEGFSVYTQYCTNYPRTMSILTELMRGEGSAKSFRERQASLGHSLPLGSYLLKPVQRILKYHLLLQNIVKTFDVGGEGAGSIVEALSCMTNIAHHINDMKRRHEHAVRVQEIQSLLYGWQGEDLTTYGELCAEGTFRAYGAKALRHVFLFDKMVLITKKKEDGILAYKTHVMCSNLMLIESVPGEPLSFHVIPFDNPRLQCTLQARNLEQKREWTLQLKRVILENYSAVIPSHARQLVMELGQTRPEERGNVSDTKVVGMKRQYSAPEYLEMRRKPENTRRKSESSLKARLRRGGRKSSSDSPGDEGSPFQGRFGRRSGGGRKASNDSTLSRDRIVSDEMEIGGMVIDRKMSSASCPPPSSSSSDKPLVKKLSGWRRKSEPGIYPSSEPQGEGPHHEEEAVIAAILDEEEEEEEVPIILPPRKESVEEIVGQLVMQNREFQRILSKQRLVHLRKALSSYQRRHLHMEEEEEGSASETETEESSARKGRAALLLEEESSSRISSGKGSSGGDSSSHGIGSSASSELAEVSSENVSIITTDGEGEVSSSSKNVQRTVSDPGNKATLNLTPRRFYYQDPLSLLWSSFRRTTNNAPPPPPSSSKATAVRHTHSFSCSRKGEEEKEDHLPHGDSGVFPHSFTSSNSSASSSEANIPTLPAVWLKMAEPHLSIPTSTKSGSLPRSFQVGGGTSSTPLPRSDRPVTLPSALGEEEVEAFMNKFNNDHHLEEDPDDDLTPTTSSSSVEALHLHPDHKIYHHTSHKSSIKAMLLSVTARLAGLKVKESPSSFGSFSNISSSSESNSLKASSSSKMLALPRNYRKILKAKLRGLVVGGEDSDSEACDLSSSSGFASSNSEIGARLASGATSDYALSKLLIGAVVEGLSRPHSVLSETSTTASSDIPEEEGEEDAVVKGLYRRASRKGLNHKDLYLSYIDHTEDPKDEDSDGSADSFYERSFEAIESLLETELFPDSAIYSAEETSTCNSSLTGSSWGISDANTKPSSVAILAARLSNSSGGYGKPSSCCLGNNNRRSRLVRSQAILDKLKVLEEASSFVQPSSSSVFEGLKSIGERRAELELWKLGGGDESCETSSTHSTSTINTVIELSPVSRRCSSGTASSSSGGTSPLSDNRKQQGWVKLLVGKLQNEPPEST